MKDSHALDIILTHSRAIQPHPIFNLNICETVLKRQSPYIAYHNRHSSD
jgi:hypothetical protein